MQILREFGVAFDTRFFAEFLKLAVENWMVRFWSSEYLESCMFLSVRGRRLHSTGERVSILLLCTLYEFIVCWMGLEHEVD